MFAEALKPPAAAEAVRLVQGRLRAGPWTGPAGSPFVTSAGAPVWGGLVLGGGGAGGLAWACGGLSRGMSCKGKKGACR